MKTTIYILIALSFIIVCNACEKVIYPDLDNMEPQVVIEAVISNQNASCEVKISESTHFSEQSSFEAVENAEVTISDDFGNSEILTETSPGIYRSATLIGIEGRTYSLKVITDGNVYTSSCRMPEAVGLDALQQISQIANNNVRRFIVPFYSDPSSQQNFYRFKVYNGTDPLDKIFVRNDLYTNGLTVSEPLGPFFVDLVPGDTAHVYMMCIEESVYDYFFSLEQTLNSNSTAPSNPVSNISGGCLGYFSAHTVSHQTIVIQE